MKTRYKVRNYNLFLSFKTIIFIEVLITMLLLMVPIASSQTCSHGTACNFIHCFRNPGGDYEWADSDKSPPRYWLKKMTSLFGYLDEYENEKHSELEYWDKFGKSSKSVTSDVDR